jgi:hypothetical protein
LKQRFCTQHFVFPSQQPRKIRAAREFSGILSILISWPLPQVAMMMSKKMRRSGRLFKSVPILLIGSDAEGRTFSEDAHSVILSLHGAGIVSNHKPIAEQEMILRSKETDREAEIRVAFLDDDLNFWQTEFFVGGAAAGTGAGMQQLRRDGDAVEGRLRV